MKQTRYLLVLLFLAVLFTTAISCKRSVTAPQGSAVSHDSAYARFAVAQNFYNNNQHDSLIAAAPEILEFLRDNQEWRLYYILWQYVADDYVWFNEFDEATKEALAMQEDAIARNDSFGIAISYGVQGTAYLLQDVYDEAQRCYKNYIQFFPYAERDGQLTDVYYNYYQCLENAKDYAAIDSLLEDWALLLKDIPPTKDSDLLGTYAIWHLKYFRRKFTYFIAKDSLTQATQLLDSLVKYTELSGNVVVEKLNIIDDRCELAMAKGDYISALRYADENLELAIGDMGNRREALMNRSKVYEKLGLYREALADLRASEALKDSVNQAKNREQLNRLNKRFALNELQSQNRLLVQRSRFTTGGVAMILSVIALLVFLVLNSRWNRRLQIKNTQLQRERNVVVAQNKQLEIERDHAEAASRAKTAFMQSMTHEIRTPLNAIVGFSDLLPVVESEEDRNQIIKEIQFNNQKLLRIINGLVSMSKIEAEAKNLVKSQTNLVSVLKDVANVHAATVDTQNVALVTQFPYTELMINTDVNKLRELVDNFMSNAVKFTLKGRITLGYDLPDGEHVRIWVTDTGLGVAEADRQRIFDRFVKVNEYVPGTGLGLSVAKSHAESLGGKIGVDSKLGEGSTFWVELPLI